MLLDSTLTILHAQLQAKEISPADLIAEAYENIETHQAATNTLISIRDKKDVIKEVAMLDPNLPLYGMPYTLKDTYVTKEIRTTAGSKILDTFISPYDATVHAKLKEAGAILVGKANLDSWGHGASNENTDYGMGHNPWDLTRVMGGSSGGPAASVALRMSAFSIGEDTGGSIRNPAAWNNVSGLKVTYGRVSRYGSIAYASSLDTVGPMAKSVEDLALILSHIAGIDKYDSSSSPSPVDDYVSQLKGKIKGLKIGIPKEMFGDGLDPVIKQAVLSASEELKKLGCELVSIPLPIAEMALATYYIIAPSETSSNLGRYDGIRYGSTRELFTQESMRRILIGTYDLSSGYYDAYYRKALKVRTLLIEQYEKALSQCDVILIPTNPTMPPKVGELMSDPLANMLADIYTTSVSLVGNPSLALPCGFSQEGLPIGLQLVGKKFAESQLLNLGYHYQQATAWHTQKPTIMGVKS